MKPLETMKLANELMQLHKLEDWKFVFDRSKLRFGQCRYQRKEIGISRPLSIANSYEDVKDVILHEIAHALTRGHHHDPIWKAKAVEIGANPNRFYDSTKVKAMPKYTLVCPTCGRTFNVNRKPASNRQYVCNRDRTPLTVNEQTILHDSATKLMSALGIDRSEAVNMLTIDAPEPEQSEERLIAGMQRARERVAAIIKERANG
jgi:predicted SprT family Zn-dependent metalloprotease